MAVVTFSPDYGLWTWVFKMALWSVMYLCTALKAFRTMTLCKGKCICFESRYHVVQTLRFPWQGGHHCNLQLLIQYTLVQTYFISSHTENGLSKAKMPQHSFQTHVSWNIPYFCVFSPELCWTDGKLHTVECVQLDGARRRTVITGTTEHYYGIAMTDTHLYITVWEAR